MQNDDTQNVRSQNVEYLPPYLTLRVKIPNSSLCLCKVILLILCNCGQVEGKLREKFARKKKNNGFMNFDLHI